MRHVYTNRVVVLMTVLLLAAAALAAWLRSRPPAPSPAPAPRAGAPTDDRHLEAGRQAWVRACAGCHASGEPGRPVPSRLSRQTEQLAAAEGGRAYLVDLMLYGASAPAEPGARRFRHPPFDTLTDAEIAGVLNLLLAAAEPAPPPFAPADITPARATPRTREDVAASRPRPAD